MINKYFTKFSLEDENFWFLGQTGFSIQLSMEDLTNCVQLGNRI